jgi:NADH-quinone oxidoreductase subunit L
VIHALDGEQDMRRMGGLKAYLPTTYWTYLVATLAIAGVPLTAGFFSKDLILWQAFNHGALALWGIGLLTAALTAFYMFRQLFMVFHGECRADEHIKSHLHESPPVMTLPLVILAIGSIVTGWLGAPEYLWGSWWDHFLQPIFAAPEHHGAIASEIMLTLLTLVVVAVGIYVAYVKYGRVGARIDQQPASWLSRLSVNKYYIDELYDFLIVRPFTACARFFARFVDPWVIDGAVSGVAATVRGFSWVWRGLQTGNVQHYLAGFLLGTLALLAYYIGEL